ncbi:MAG TPA: Ppx/GppA family phosphatase [Burkholderiaceae bacterium]|nr:Ppx/GppA family phosphatase [Burkholderiaceae bacterium]
MPDLLAALDLGSNSFRLSTGRIVRHNGCARVETLTRLKETVRLASGLDADGQLNGEVTDRAAQVLHAFAAHLQAREVSQVRAVATNTLRIARNLDIVLPRLETALGYPIEIVSGIEEARLIFVGISHDLPDDNATRLMVDIGGGSTEIILGQNQTPLHLDSLPMGCLSFTHQFFADGTITKTAMAQAVQAASTQVAKVAGPYQQTGWQQAYGSSGTAKGLLAVLQETGFAPEGITTSGLLRLKHQLEHDGQVRLDTLPGLKPARVHVLAGGLAIMLGIFQTLGITQAMVAGEGALRRGVMAEMIPSD